MNGILNVLKPPGMTSSDVVVLLRRELKIKKTGHTGTLDPEAAGVLPVCLGKATRIADYIMHRDKIYRCGMKLGVTTDTSDLTGSITSKTDDIPSLERIKDALRVFQGELNQIPPMHSAIKVDGKKLYELARKGIEVERKPRRIRIMENKFLSFTPPDVVLFETTCSKGTYIRALCRDIGDWLGCGAVMSHLIRVASGSFTLQNSHSLDEILACRDQGKLETLVVPMKKALEQVLPSIVLKDQCKEQVSHGNQVGEKDIVSIVELTNDKADKVEVSGKTSYSIFCGDSFMGIGFLAGNNGRRVVKIKSVLI